LSTRDNQSAFLFFYETYVLGRLSGALSVFGGFAAFRLLQGTKLLLLKGLPRLLAFGAGTGAGAHTYSLLHGSFHYLFTGDSSLLKESLSWENLLSNFTMGAVLGPLGAKLFRSIGPANLMKGPGNWIAGLTAKLLKKPFSRKLASQINKGVHIVKNSAIYSGATSLITSAFDAFSQWRQTGKVDWKKNGKRAAIVAALTIPLIGAGMFAGTKAKIFGDDAPVISRSIQNNDVHVSINKPKADGGDVKTDVDVPEFKEPVAGDSKGVNLRVTDEDLITPKGKFIDLDLETNYTNYIARKAKEGKAPKDRLEWKKARDYWLNDSPMARGNKFNKTVRNRDIYDYHEIHLENGKRLDSYDPFAKEIISRKATDLDMIDEKTYRVYLKEMNDKYSAGTKIRSNAYPELDGKPLEGKLVLEIPATNRNLADIEKYKQIAKEYGVVLRFMEE
jgi:hypothetical protein